MGQSDEFNGHGIVTHDFSRNRVDCHLIRAGEDQVLDVPPHRPGARAVSCERPVGHSEDSRMNLFLDSQQVHQCLVNHRVRPVTLVVQQSTECVFHRACHRCEHVSLHGGQMDDVLAHEHLWDFDAVGVHLV